MKFWTMVALEAGMNEDSSAKHIQVRSADRAEIGVAAMTAVPDCPAEECRSAATGTAYIGMELP